MTGLPSTLVVIGRMRAIPEKMCPTCGEQLWEVIGKEWWQTGGPHHNPPGCPMRVIRGRYAKDWTEGEWEAERAAHPEENLRPW